MKRAVHLPAALLLSTSLLAQLPPSHHWPLDESTGLHANDITGGADGDLQNGATWQPTGGHFGGALQFDGADDRVDLGPCEVTSGMGFSISLWMQAGLMAGNEQVLIAKTQGPDPEEYVWSVSQVNSTALLFRLQAGGTVTELQTPQSSLFSGSWYHVAASYDGAMMRIHLNGALMAFTPKGGMIPWVPQAPASMGDRLDGNGSFMGLLDDVRLYDHGLNDAEITDLVIGDVATTAGGDQQIAIVEDRIRIPRGDWLSLRIHDGTGRMLEQRSAKEGDELVLLDRPAGLYLFCLQGRHGALVRPLVMP